MSRDFYFFPLYKYIDLVEINFPGHTEVFYNLSHAQNFTFIFIALFSAVFVRFCAIYKRIPFGGKRVFLQ